MRWGQPWVLGSNGARQIDTIDKQQIITRSEHIVSRSNISKNALKVMYRLKEAGYEAYLVGGGVRDLLLGREPKDFDVATNARPEEIEQLFRNARLIGRRFRLAHVRFGQEIIEVATFRGQLEKAEGDEEARTVEGMIVRDNVYGTVEEDAWRRDFSVNSLYYNIRDFSVVDFVGGIDDLRNGVLRLIGDPDQRYREDPVRMLRAVRFAAKLGFRIHPASEKPLFELGYLLEAVPPARLFEEVLKLFLGGDALKCFELLRHYHLFEHLFPATEDSLAEEEEGFPPTLLVRALANTDQRIATGKPVTPAFLFAALLWDAVRVLRDRLIAEGQPPIQAGANAAEVVLQQQAKRVSIPRRFSLPMREIWGMQDRFASRSPKRVHRLFAHPRFRAAYDFMLLRCEAGEEEQELCDWWTRFQEVEEAERKPMLDSLAPSGKKPRRRRRRSRAPKETSS